MSHTNTTSNFGLPQFITTDKPAWLTDINVAYQAIDTAMKNNQDAAGSAQSDATQALSDAAAAGGTATTADAKASGAIASISESFESTNTYNVGELVIYNNLLYRCVTAVTNPGPWTGSSNWERINVDTLNSEAKTAISLVDQKVDDLDDYINDFAYQNVSSQIQAAFPTLENVLAEMYKIGNIGFLNLRCYCTGAVSSGNVNLAGLNFLPKGLYEYRGALSSKSNRGGFIQISGNTFLIRCSTSEGEFMVGSIIFPIETT